MANQGTSCSAKAGNPGYYCSVGSENYYGIVTNTCFSFSLFHMDRFIPMIHSFSAIENLNVPVGENMSFVYWLPDYKLSYLGFLERASYQPEMLGSRYDAVTARDIGLDPLEKQ